MESARYVRLQTTLSEPLNLAELEVVNTAYDVSVRVGYGSGGEDVATEPTRLTVVETGE